ncbi:hypothetical protein [uncultured Sphingomonas sp.]|uniref:hypothetical protein n=1 Tax=uncultured Sphingomonas sp. TaxID=158754 RepID=UPI0035CBB0EC
MPRTLEDYHARIEAHMAEGDSLLAARDPAIVSHVRQRIADAAVLIASYQLFVHREVFAPLLDHPDAAARARVTEIKAECIALTEDLRFNVKEFLARDQVLDWDLTAARVAWFNKRVRGHIASVGRLMAGPLGPAERAASAARAGDRVGAQQAA